MDIALIAAVANNGVVGRDNQLPWHLPGDLPYFKRVTFGKPVIMGRKTWESIGRPLPGRTNIVISRQPQLQLAGAQVVATLQQALELAAGVAKGNELMVIGGAEIYALALPLATRLYITEVRAEVAGDAFFPLWDRAEWVERTREDYVGQNADSHDYSFVVYERKGGASGSNSA